MLAKRFQWIFPLNALRFGSHLCAIYVSLALWGPSVRYLREYLCGASYDQRSSVMINSDVLNQTGYQNETHIDAPPCP